MRNCGKQIYNFVRFRRPKFCSSFNPVLLISISDVTTKNLIIGCPSKHDSNLLGKSQKLPLLPPIPSQFSNHSFIYDENGSLLIEGRRENMTPPEPAPPDPILIVKHKNQTLNPSSLSPLSIGCKRGDFESSLNCVNHPPTRVNLNGAVFNSTTIVGKQGSQIRLHGASCDASITGLADNPDSRRESSV